jgi:tetratricopeptide (TPR) repeat protein
MINVGNCLLAERRFGDAETLYRQARAVARRVLRPDHPYAAAAELGLAEALARQGRRDEALSSLRESIEGEVDADTCDEIAGDPDLASLHRDPRFAAIVADARRRASVAK